MVYALALLPIKDRKGNPIRVSSDDWCFKKVPGGYEALHPHKFIYGYVGLRQDLFSEYPKEKHIAYRMCEDCLFRQVLEPSFGNFNSRHAQWREESIR
jgi:hypothetical protein